MSTVSDRSLWLAHLRYCTLCPTNLCDRGLELAAAVLHGMAPDETWDDVYGIEEQIENATPDRLERPR